jgi:[histone H3]-lysine79 N-trimethyltransferase
LRPKKTDEYNPREDIFYTVDKIVKYYLPTDSLATDFLHQFRKAIKSPDPTPLLPLLKTLNDTIISHRPFTRTVSNLPHIPRDLLHRLIFQSYTRHISPHLDGLKKYTAFSSTVYGELKPVFLSKLFSQLYLSPQANFVDLGCGVGNCLLQAAAETGCTATGIEVMDHAASLARAQITDFESRMRAWGLSHGKITFLHGDILTHPSIPSLLRTATVVLCNNYAFSADLNDALLRLFLELPEGARVVSLKSFVPVGKDGRVRGGRGGVGEMLRVEIREFEAESVSWMPSGGEYFVSTVCRVGSPNSGEA